MRLKSLHGKAETKLSKRKGSSGSASILDYFGRKWNKYIYSLKSIYTFKVCEVAGDYKKSL